VFCVCGILIEVIDVNDFDTLKQIIIALRDKDIGKKIEDHIDSIIELTMQAEKIMCNISGCSEDITPYLSTIHTFISRLAEKKGIDFAINVANAYCVILELMATPLEDIVIQENEEFWERFKEEEEGKDGQ